MSGSSSRCTRKTKRRQRKSRNWGPSSTGIIGNESYVDYLRHVSKRAYDNGIISKDEYYEMAKFNN
eukprot:7896946-Heterocapsa_arctica.AAC.1